MNADFKDIILKSTGAQEFFIINKIQDLWSGYGVLSRYGLKGTEISTIVVKHVRLSNGSSHPIGWNTNLSHQRKLKSYEVEMSWYRHWSRLCDDACRVPKCFACASHNNEVLIVLEDLNGAGYDVRRSSVSSGEIKVCLKWLANFHATFMNTSPDHLWNIGTYWHLDTRPDEWRVLSDKKLKNAAQAIDQRLQAGSYQTFVHGDAKLANFCFSKDGQNVAAVDFQYVGGGCGMKDVVYFIGSCLNEDECERLESELLDYYFHALSDVLQRKQPEVDVFLLEKDWRFLYKFAWTDFHRFLKGWSPGHWKINGYSERLVRKTLEEV